MRHIIMRSPLIATTMISLLLASGVAAEQPTAADERVGDRYRIASANEMLILLDSLTGESWMLDGHRSGDKLQWLRIARVEPTETPASVRTARKTQSHEFAVAFAPEANSVIVRGNEKEIAKAALLLQRSDFGQSSGLEMTVSFFRELDFGHISIPGQRSDVEEVKHIVKDVKEIKRIVLTNNPNAK